MHKAHLFFSIVVHFGEATDYITAVILPILCSSFSAFRRNDFGVEPVPSLQASGELFLGRPNHFGRPKTQLAMFV